MRRQWQNEPWRYASTHKNREAEGVASTPPPVPTGTFRRAADVVGTTKVINFCPPHRQDGDATTPISFKRIQLLDLVRTVIAFADAVAFFYQIHERSLATLRTQLALRK